LSGGWAAERPDHRGDQDRIDSEAPSTVVNSHDILLRGAGLTRPSPPEAIEMSNGFKTFEIRPKMAALCSALAVAWV
jgi:hypothetical protein